MPRQKKNGLAAWGIYGTPHWSELRYQAWRRADGRCERCYGPLDEGQWHLHHLTYKHAGRERLNEVEAICVPCHQAEHPNKSILDAKGIRREQADQRRAARDLKRAKKQSRTNRFVIRIGREPKVCGKCGGRLSLLEHERQCLGINAMRPRIPK